MRSFRTRWFRAWILAGALLAPAGAGATTYDAATGFSTTTNPLGVWTYGWKATLGGALAPFTSHATTLGLDWWTTPAPNGASVNHNGTGSTVVMVASPVLSALAGEMWMHPGQAGQIAVLRFTAPVTGSYDLAAGFWGIDAKPTSTGVHVLVNGVASYDAVVNSYRGTPQSYATTGLPLLAGDTVDFAVDWGPNLDWGWDSTGVSASLVLVPEPQALLLLASGLVGLQRFGRRRRDG